MEWAYLIIAGLFETCWAISLKFSEGFSKPISTILTILGIIISFIFLSKALHHLPLGTAYAIWTGIGILGTFFLGVFLFNEPISILKIVFVTFILIGIIGLRLTSSI